MPRRCSVCAHAECESIDRALLRAEPYRNIAERFALSIGALSRHHAGGHLSEALVAAGKADQIASADRLLTEVDDLLGASKRILATAEANGDLRVALLAVREARASAETIARVGTGLPPRVTRSDGPRHETHVPLLAWLAKQVLDEPSD